MREEVAEVLAGARRWWAEPADCLAFARQLPTGCADLVFFSPPYTGARLYLEGGEDLGVVRDAEQWAAWMVEVFREYGRVCKGLVACVCDDQTRGYRYGCAPYLLMADLCRAGFNLRRPCVYRRSGIPGSGGPDWFRCDHEPIICVTPPGRLPWSDTTACGHPPRWAPGGACSNRLTDGQRVDKWGKNGKAAGTTNRGGREKDGAKKVGAQKKFHTKTRRRQGTDQTEKQTYHVPAVANPGTVVQRLYTAEEVTELLGHVSDVADCKVGGGQMGEGDLYARRNEAPYPEELVERFVLSFCPPGGLCLDPFCGSGTTAAVAARWGRRALTCDLRPSQVELARKRIGGETPLALFTDEPEPTEGSNP